MALTSSHQLDKIWWYPKNLKFISVSWRASKLQLMKFGMYSSVTRNRTKPPEIHTARKAKVWFQVMEEQGLRNRGCQGCHWPPRFSENQYISGHWHLQNFQCLLMMALPQNFLASAGPAWHHKRFATRSVCKAYILRKHAARNLNISCTLFFRKSISILFPTSGAYLMLHVGQYVGVEPSL